MSIPILRTKLDLDWGTTTGTGSLLLPIDCAVFDSNTWPWKYFWTKTLGTFSPVTTNAIVRESDSQFVVNGSHPSGQTVIRGIFAYVATDNISASVSLSASSSTWEGGSRQKNITLLARRYNYAGGPSGILQTYISSTSGTASASITLPATVCPQVIWLGAAIQPTGEDGLHPLPSTQAEVTFSL